MSVNLSTFAPCNSAWTFTVLLSPSQVQAVWSWEEPAWVKWMWHSLSGQHLQATYHTLLPEDNPLHPFFRSLHPCFSLSSSDLFSFVFSTFSLLVNSPKVKVYTPKEDMKFAFWKTITVNPSWILQVKDLFLSSVVLQRVWILSAEVFRHLRLIPQPLFQHKGDRWNFVFVVKRKKKNISEIIISASLVRYDHRRCIPVAGL